MREREGGMEGRERKRQRGSGGEGGAEKGSIILLLYTAMGTPPVAQREVLPEKRYRNRESKEW